MNEEDYFKYYIQGSDHYLIPKDVFIELFNEMVNWKEESKILRKNAENNDKVVDKVNWENQLLKKENKQLKIQISAREEVYNRLESNWNKLTEIAKSQSGFTKRADLKGGLWFEIDELLDKMQELEQGSDK